MKDSIDDDDDDEWDESNELEELDLGFNILPGSLFQLMAIKNIFNIKNILIQRGSKLILEQVYHIPYQSPRAYLSCNLDSGSTSTEPSITS